MKSSRVRNVSFCSGLSVDLGMLMCYHEWYLLAKDRSYIV